MVKRSTLNPLEEARARIRLRYAPKTKPVYSGMKQVGLPAMRLTRNAIPKRGATLSKLKLNWHQIVGEQIARLCEPEKLSPAKGGQQLTLKVVSAAAGLVQHQSEMIRQRVSVAAGGTITKLKLIQGQISGRQAPVKLSANLALTESERSALKESVSDIENEKLRAAIVALGEAVLSAEKNEIENES